MMSRRVCLGISMGLFESVSVQSRQLQGVTGNDEIWISINGLANTLAAQQVWSEQVQLNGGILQYKSQLAAACIPQRPCMVQTCRFSNASHRR